MDAKEKRRKTRRRQRRVVAISGFLLLAIGSAWFFELQATTTVILVRHADVTADLPEKATLSAAGRRRAQELARVLASVDVVRGVDVIFATQPPSSAETAQPLSDLLGLEVLEADALEHKDLRRRILREFKGKVVLIVTRDETIQPIIEDLHGSKNVSVLGDAEYDNIYIITVPWFGKVKTLQLKYGLAYAEPAAS